MFRWCNKVLYSLYAFIALSFDILHLWRQHVIAVAAAYEYAEVEDILKNAEEKGEPPFIFILDNIEDPHNLGAIIRRCV